MLRHHINITFTTLPTLRIGTPGPVFRDVAAGVEPVRGRGVEL